MYVIRLEFIPVFRQSAACDDVSSKPIGANIRQINGYLSTTGGPQPHFYKTNPVDHTMLLIFGLAYLFVYSKIRRSVADNK